MIDRFKPDCTHNPPSMNAYAPHHYSQGNASMEGCFKRPSSYTKNPQKEPSSALRGSVYQSSLLGCNGCRNRHLKCDQILPQCLNCRADNMTCTYLDIGQQHVTGIKRPVYNHFQGGSNMKGSCTSPESINRNYPSPPTPVMIPSQPPGFGLNNHPTKHALSLNNHPVKQPLYRIERNPNPTTQYSTKDINFAIPRDLSPYTMMPATKAPESQPLGSLQPPMTDVTSKIPPMGAISGHDLVNSHVPVLKSIQPQYTSHLQGPLSMRVPASPIRHTMVPGHAMKAVLQSQHGVNY
ncbi:hypothetical protein JCM33374_g1887 [Metschnikowia sp. JCM 33374]|nr:hypothetical protein JCM33374_g1887 [Metschnikowia sp. JCM 33374]